MGVIERASLAFQTQDLRCGRCHRTRASAVRRACECSGAYATDVPAYVFRGALLNFRRLAAAFNFKWLAETVRWLEEH